MNEQQWLSCTDPYDMLMFFPSKWDRRKLLLFGSACLRRVWHLLPDWRTRNCIEVEERVVDGQATEDEAARAWEAFLAAVDQDELEGFRGLDTPEAMRNLICFVDPAASLCVASEVAEGVGCVAAQAKWEERAAQTALLRDIFGNPFRPVQSAPGVLAWNDGAVVKLAKAIYEQRRFEDMPLLADTLDDAGCTNKDILAHCRKPGGVHVRGCWVIDYLLCKS